MYWSLTSVFSALSTVLLFALMVTLFWRTVSSSLSNVSLTGAVGWVWVVPVVFVAVLVSAANAGTTMPHSRAAERPAAMVRFILFSPFCYAAAVVISTPSLAHSYWLYAVYSDRYALSTFSFAVVTASCAC